MDEGIREDVEGWILHVVGGDAPGEPAGESPLLRALAARGAIHAVAGASGGRTARVLDVARRLRRRPDPERAEVRWPEMAPVPVVHAHGPGALRAAWLALCLTGAPARLTALWGHPRVPDAPRLWRRCDVAMARTPGAARALRAGGLEGRRIRVLTSAPAPERGEAGPAEAILGVYRTLAAAPFARARRLDWTLR